MHITLIEKRLIEKRCLTIANPSPPLLPSPHNTVIAIQSFNGKSSSNRRAIACAHPEAAFSIMIILGIPHVWIA